MPITVEPLSPHVGCVINADGSSPSPPEPAEVLDLLSQYGAIIFRGFADSPQQFSRLTERYCSEFSAYEGGVQRGGAFDRKKVGNEPTLFFASGADQGFKIPLHGEMYYLRRYPSIIWFFCDTPPAARGETTVCDGRRLWQELPETARTEFLSRRVAYTRSIPLPELEAVIPGGAAAIERFCAATGTTLIIDESQGTAQMRCVCSPVVGLGPGETPCFINIIGVIWNSERILRRLKAASGGSHGMDRFPVVVRWEDGSEIPAALMDQVDSAGERCTADIRWHKGDIAMIDNRRVMHGRRDSRNVTRVIMVRMGEPISVPSSTPAP